MMNGDNTLLMTILDIMSTKVPTTFCCRLPTYWHSIKVPINRLAEKINRLEEDSKNGKRVGVTKNLEIMQPKSSKCTLIYSTKMKSASDC